MRIRDWSSDVCSSDLLSRLCPQALGDEFSEFRAIRRPQARDLRDDEPRLAEDRPRVAEFAKALGAMIDAEAGIPDTAERQILDGHMENDVVEGHAARHGARQNSAYFKIGRASCRERVCQYV